MKYTLITGASGGIGADFARILTSKGENVVLTARRSDELEKLKTELSANSPHSRIALFTCDISDPQSVSALCESISRAGLQIECLINNAGSGHYGFFNDYPFEKDDHMMMLNMTGLVQLTKFFLPSMVTAGHGRILNVASTAAFLPGPLMAVYYATKAFVLSFSEALSNELKGTGVTVTVLCPGPTATGFQNAAQLNHSRLLKLLQPAGSRAVAEFGISAMEKGRRIAVPGLLNLLTVQFPRFFPRRLITASVRIFQSATKSKTGNHSRP